MVNAVARYFDLQSDHRSVVTDGHAAESKHAPVLPQYLALAVGVILEPSLRQYITSGTWQFPWSGLLPRVAFGLIVGIIILPAVYRSAFDTEKPIAVQLAALFPLGIGWQSLFTSATKIVA